MINYCLPTSRKKPKIYNCKGYPKVKTCGVRNPYYKYLDYYYSEKLGRNINRCQIEEYFTGWLLRNININPQENIVTYYRTVVAYVRPLYFLLVDDYGMHYSNLSKDCTALLIIKRCLSKIFSEAEAARILYLLGIDFVCQC